MMKQVIIFTDGACINNPGPGGWAAVLMHEQHTKEIYGCDPHTTNNKMELTAAIEALKALKEPCVVSLFSDSKYLCNGINLHWAESWRKRGWKKSDGTEPKNIPLWEELLELTEKHTVSFQWVKGHDGNEYNERCDELATTAAAKQISSKEKEK